MLMALVSAVQRWCKPLLRRLPPSVPSLLPASWQEEAPEYEPLREIVLTDGVCRTLFEEYAEHRRGQRGEEETGWVLMGHRLKDQAIVLATLPAGARREAGIAHVRFNSDAQALASRILRQEDRQLGILGVVHTHPGSLRHPSHGDYQGDRQWVNLLRGEEGIFGIGTADGEEDPESPLVAFQPRRHSQCYLGLQFSWYVLGAGDRAYRTVPIQVTIGPDLARPLHGVWSTIELHARRLDNLCRTVARVRFELLAGEAGSTLEVIVPRGSSESLRVLLREDQAEYCLVRKGEWLMSQQREPLVDRGVYLMLAALAEEN